MNIFLGFRNTAGFLEAIDLALKDMGHQTCRGIIENNTYYKDVDAQVFLFKPLKTANPLINLFRQSIHRIRKAWFFFRTLAHFDCYFLFGEDSFLPFRLDYLILKMLSKKVYICFLGSDIRYIPVQNLLAKNYGAPQMEGASYHGFFTCLMRHKWPEWLGIPIVSVANQSTFARRPFYFFQIPQFVSGVKGKKTNERPLVIHAPTNRDYKGTDKVLAAVEQLKAEGLVFDFHLIEKMSNEKLMELLNSVDIVIDEPSSWVGKLSIEACAHSCAVVGGNNPEYESPPVNSPVIPFGDDCQELADSVRPLLADSVYRQRKMNDCYRFWTQVYSPEAFQEWINNLFAGKAHRVHPDEMWQSTVRSGAKTWWHKCLIWLFY